MIIKVESAYHYASLNTVLIGGQIESGNGLKKGDILYNMNNSSEMYTIKGTALMKPIDGYRSIVNIQLEPGNYSVNELIGKTLISELSSY